MRALRSGVAVLVALAVLGGGAAWVSAQSVESRLGGARSKERSLAASVAQLGRLLDEVASDIAVLRRREGQVQVDLDFERQRLDRYRADLRSERARVARLRARLKRSQIILSRRLVELYKSGEPDLITVLMSADGFAELVERGAFLRRVQRQDRRVLLLVRSARRDAQAGVRRLRRLTARQEAVTEAIARRRAALAQLRAQMQAKQASLARARAARAAALRQARGNRQRLERELARLQRARAASFATAGGGGSWAIPWAIVQCESGGQNMPPNHAGASGYYQFIPATWRRLGGSTAHAYQASKAEQDRLAAQLWASGRGAHNWDCYDLLHGRRAGASRGA